MNCLFLGFSINILSHSKRQASETRRSEVMKKDNLQQFILQYFETHHYPSSVSEGWTEGECQHIWLLYYDFSYHHAFSLDGKYSIL